MLEKNIAVPASEVNEPYVKCQNDWLPWVDGPADCDENATESVNLHDPKYPDDPERDTIMWVCSRCFEGYYHSSIIRTADGSCDCRVCTGKEKRPNPRTTEVPR